MFRALKFIEREWLSAWTKEGRQKIEPEWRDQLERSRPNRLQRAVLVRTSRVSLSRNSIRLSAGGTGKLSSGARPRDLARAVEFGQDQGIKTRYYRKDPPVPAPAKHVVTRRTARPVGPKSANGKVVWPALGRFVPRAAAIATDLFYEILRRVPGVN